MCSGFGWEAQRAGLAWTRGIPFCSRMDLPETVFPTQPEGESSGFSSISLKPVTLRQGEAALDIKRSLSLSEF